MKTTRERLTAQQREALWKWRWLGLAESTPAFKASLVLSVLAASAILAVALAGATSCCGAPGARPGGGGGPATSTPATSGAGVTTPTTPTTVRTEDDSPTTTGHGPEDAPGGADQGGLGPGASLEGGSGTRHTGSAIYTLIVASERTRGDAERRREDAASALGEFETYFVIDRSEHYEGMRPGWWVVFEPYKTRSQAVGAMEQTRSWLAGRGIEPYVKRVVVRCRDRFTLVGDQWPGD